MIAVLNATVSASRPMMAKLRKLGVKIKARWIPYAVNRVADALLQTLHPGDVRASEMVGKVQEE